MNNQTITFDITPVLAALSILRDRLDAGNCNADAIVSLLESERLVRLSSVTAGGDVTLRFEPSDAFTHLLSDTRIGRTESPPR
jgi:hypothetical protein